MCCQLVAASCRVSIMWRLTAAAWLEARETQGSTEQLRNPSRPATCLPAAAEGMQVTSMLVHLSGLEACCMRNHAATCQAELLRRGPAQKRRHQRLQARELQMRGRPPSPAATRSAPTCRQPAEQDSSTQAACRALHAAHSDWCTGRSACANQQDLCHARGGAEACAPALGLPLCAASLAADGRQRAGE